MDSKATGEFITLLRKEKGITQKQLADALNVTDKAVSRWETGKGLPDVSSLLRLSEIFSVTVNELLYGQKIEKDEIEKAAEINMVTVLNNSAAGRKKSKKTIAIISVIAAIAILVSAVFGYFAFRGMYRHMMGSENCVVAADYSYITYYGEKYVPLPLNRWYCETGEILLIPRIEGIRFWETFFSSTIIYSVLGCAENDLVILQSDYDPLISEYYCKESRYEYYQNLEKTADAQKYYAIIYQRDWSEGKKEIDSDFMEYLFNLTDTKSNIDSNTNRSAGEECMEVIALDESGIFHNSVGEILKKNGEYYWFDYDDIPEEQNNADYSRFHPYIIGDEYDEMLDEYFSYMFK